MKRVVRSGDELLCLHTISETRAIRIVGVHSTAKSRHGVSPRMERSRLLQPLVMTRVAVQNIAID